MKAPRDQPTTSASTSTSRPTPPTSMSTTTSPAEDNDSIKTTQNNEPPFKNIESTDNELEQRRHKIHDRIVNHFNKKVSKHVFSNQTRVMQRSAIHIIGNSGSLSTNQGLLEDKVYKLYQMLEDLEMELLMANSKIKSYFVGLGVRIRNTRKELRNTIENTKTPDILARYNKRQRSNKNKNFKGSSSQKKPRLNVKRKRLIRFSKHFECSSGISRQNSNDECANASSSPSPSSSSSPSTNNGPQLKSCLKQQKVVVVVVVDPKPSTQTLSEPQEKPQEVGTPKPETVRKDLSSTRTKSLSMSSSPRRRRRRSKLLPNKNGVKKVLNKSRNVQAPRKRGHNYDKKCSKKANESGRKTDSESNNRSGVHNPSSEQETTDVVYKKCKIG